MVDRFQDRRDAGRVLAERLREYAHDRNVLVLALPRCAFGVESHGGRDTDPLAYGLFREHPELRDGHIHIGDKPGFGLDPDWQFVKRYQV